MPQLSLIKVKCGSSLMSYTYVIARNRSDLPITPLRAR